MKITPILWTYQKSKTGLYPVKIRVFYIRDGIEVSRYYPLPVKVKKTEWDAKTGQVKNTRNAIEINQKILQVLTQAEKERLNKGDGIDVEKIIDLILNPPVPKVEYTPVSYFENYIARMKAGTILHHKTKQSLDDGYIKAFESSMKRLKAFIENKKRGRFAWEDISEDFYDQYVSYLRHDYINKDLKPKKINKTPESKKGVRENTIGISIKHMVTVFKRAKKDGLLNIYDFKGFVVITQPVDTIALTIEEVHKIVSADLYGMPTLQKERERFLIAYNFLLRFNDSVSISKENIYEENGRKFLRMTTEKTKESVIIPIMPMVHDILEKNNFSIKKISNQKSNDALKRLGKEAGIDQDYQVTEYIKGKKVNTVYKRYELMTTHTTRRSAATNLYLSNMDLNSIRMFGAWKTIQQLMNYIKIEKLENAKKQIDHPFFSMEGILLQ